MSVSATRWQHTRCRIGSVTLKHEKNVIRLQACEDFCWQVLWDIRDLISNGRLQSLGVVAVTVDRCTMTAFSVGDGMYSALAGGTADLQRRLLTEK